MILPRLVVFALSLAATACSGGGVLGVGGKDISFYAMVARCDERRPA